MFYCDSCHILQNPHEKEFHLIAEMRANGETIREIRVCQTCYNKSNIPQQIAERQAKKRLEKAVRKSNRVTEDDE